jgi:hypothetical protein
LRRAEQQRHPGLRHHRGEPAGEVEGQVPDRPEGILDILAEDRQEQHVAQDVVPAAVQEHGGDPAEAPGLRPAAGAVDRTRVERGVVDRRVELVQLVEDPHGEVGHDQQHIDDPEPPSGKAV